MGLKLDNINDLSELREIARVLNAENDRLHRRLNNLAGEVDKLKGQDAATLQNEIAGLQSELDRERKKHSQPRSERRKSHRRRKKSKRKPQSGGKRTEQPELELIDEERTLPENERQCEQCGGIAEALPNQYEEGELVTVVQREFKVLHYPCSPKTSSAAKTQVLTISRLGWLGLEHPNGIQLMRSSSLAFLFGHLR